MATTVPMLAPDGTSGDIPQERVQDAIKAGFKQAVEMTSPDGKAGYIPVERQQDALSAGFKLAAPPQPGMLDPRGGWNAGDVLRGAVNGVKTLFSPQGVAGMGESVVASGGGGMYPTTAPTMRPADSQANFDVQKQAQQGQADAAKSTAQNPAYAIGGVIGPAVVTAGIAKGAPMLADVAVDAMPAAAKARAGGLLQSVAHDANKVPVQLDNAGDSALKLMDWQKVTQLGPTVNKFLNRITNPKLGPLTYEEGRQFYQILGKMSVDETMKMAPPIRRELTGLVVGLKQDLGDAAAQVGKAADYYQGLGDYATAAKHQEWIDQAKSFLANETAKGIFKGIGAGAGGALGYGIYRELNKSQ